MHLWAEQVILCFFHATCLSRSAHQLELHLLPVIRGWAFDTERDRWDHNDFPGEFKESNLKAILGSQCQVLSLHLGWYYWMKWDTPTAKPLSVGARAEEDAGREHGKGWGGRVGCVWVNRAEGRQRCEIVCVHILLSVRVCNTFSALLTVYVSLSTSAQRSVWTVL